MRINLNDISVTNNDTKILFDDASSRTYSAGTSWSSVDSMGNRLVAGCSDVDLAVADTCHSGDSILSRVNVGDSA
jgi:hypothetical protein